MKDVNFWGLNSKSNSGGGGGDLLNIAKVGTTAMVGVAMVGAVAGAVKGVF